MNDKEVLMRLKGSCNVHACVCPVPQPAAAPVAPVPAGLGVFGCPGNPPASGTSEHTGSDNLSSTQRSPSPWTNHKTRTFDCFDTLKKNKSAVLLQGNREKQDLSSCLVIAIGTTFAAQWQCKHLTGSFFIVVVHCEFAPRFRLSMQNNTIFFTIFLTPLCSPDLPFCDLDNSLLPTRM